MNNTFDARWRQPTSILDPRLFQFSGNVDLLTNHGGRDDVVKSRHSPVVPSVRLPGLGHSPVFPPER